MKKMFFFLLCCFVLSACGKNYSIGERTGIINKISLKGLIFKSYEAEMIMTIPISQAGITTPETFYFNVDPACVEKIKKNISNSNQVKVFYRQWFIKPVTIDHDHVVFDIIELNIVELDE